MFQNEGLTTVKLPCCIVAEWKEGTALYVTEWRGLQPGNNGTGIHRSLPFLGWSTIGQSAALKHKILNLMQFIQHVVGPYFGIPPFGWDTAFQTDVRSSRAQRGSIPGSVSHTIHALKYRRSHFESEAVSYASLLLELLMATKPSQLTVSRMKPEWYPRTKVHQMLQPFSHLRISPLQRLWDPPRWNSKFKLQSWFYELEYCMCANIASYKLVTWCKLLERS